MTVLFSNFPKWTRPCLEKRQKTSSYMCGRLNLGQSIIPDDQQIEFKRFKVAEVKKLKT